jgi:hypothetical protein
VASTVYREGLNAIAAGAGLAAGERQRYRSYPGTSSTRRLEENVAAVEVQLTPEEMQRIEAVAPASAAAGARYDASRLRLVNV